jgi:hypothetical protein
MTARQIKRRNARRMTRHLRATVWVQLGGQADRIPGALCLLSAPLSFRREK